MKLVDLDPCLVRCIDDKSFQQLPPEAPVNNADGAMFLCPACFRKNSGPVGTHSVLVWFRDRVSDERTPGPGRWIASGNTITDLTLSPSVDVGCWHGFVTNGEVSTC